MLTNDIQLRNYLLGTLPESESERLEELLIDNEEVFLTLRSIENDLFDEYVRDEMDPEERDAFLRRYGSQTNRLTFASALATKKADVVAFAPRPRWIGLAAAAALLIAIGTVLLVEDRRPRLSNVPRQVSAPVVQTVAVTVTLGTSRSTTGAQLLAIPASASTVELRVRLHPDDRFDRYQARIASSAGVTVWEANELRAIEKGEEVVLLCAVPASSLGDGSYELAVRGGDEDLGFSDLEVQRTK